VLPSVEGTGVDVTYRSVGVGVRVGLSVGVAVVLVMPSSSSGSSLKPGVTGGVISVRVCPASQGRLCGAGGSKAAAQRRF